MNVEFSINSKARVIPFHSIIILLLIITVSGCFKAPTEIEIKDDLSESDFKKALIGKWESVYQREGHENVERLEVFPFGIANVIINNGLKVKVTGKYEIYFLRPPAEGNVTIAEMTITSDNTQIKLSRMKFGYHNGVHMSLGILLRIDESPYGALTKI